MLIPPKHHGADARPLRLVGMDSNIRAVFEQTDYENKDSGDDFKKDPDLEVEVVRQSRAYWMRHVDMGHRDNVRGFLQ